MVAPGRERRNCVTHQFCIWMIALLLLIAIAAPVFADTTMDAPEPLSEEECAELASRAEEPAPEVAGKALSNQHLTYIVIALAAAVVVLIFA